MAVACQPQARTEDTKAAPPPASIVGSVAAATPAKTATSVAGLAAVEFLSPEMQQILQNHDLSPLLQTVGSGGAHAQNGFFGSDHYRIKMAFTDVHRDPTHPNVFFLRGKDRYNGRVTPFAGTFTLRRFGAQPAGTAQQVALPVDRFRIYSAEGRFELREESTNRGAGIFQGQLNIDFIMEDDGSLFLELESEKFPSKGGVKYEGTWTNNKTHRVQPVVWVEDIVRYGNENKVLADFAFVERHPYFNPKYAHLGWNNYWNNEEWWAATKHHSATPAKASAEHPDTITSLGI